MQSFDVVERRASWEDSEAATTICEELDSQFNNTGTFDITKYDLVIVLLFNQKRCALKWILKQLYYYVLIFSPISSNRHYCLVCFSLKTGVCRCAWQCCARERYSRSNKIWERLGSTNKFTVETILKHGCVCWFYDKVVLLLVGMEMVGCTDTICHGSDMLAYILTFYYIVLLKYWNLDAFVDFMIKLCWYLLVWKW